MKKKILILLTLIISLNLYSQITFEKGYLIDNSNHKIECIIRNLDWRYNPTDIEYKLSENNDIIKTNVKDIAEFGIYNTSKYVRSTVKIDKSSENINYLTSSKNPLFTEEILLLKVLVESTTNLYIYENINGQRFFYNKNNSNIEQLVYKIYLNDDDKILKNNMFKQQLWTDLKCSTVEIGQLENLNYTKKSLTNFFINYNKCKNLDFINYDQKVRKDVFNLTLRLHLNNSSLIVENTLYRNSFTDFGNKTSFGFGIETEFIIPYNKGKWAVLAEPTYKNFKSEKITDAIDVSGGKLNSIIDYTSIELPIGLRHYYFINTNSKIFVNASYILTFDTKSSIDFKRADNSTLNTLEIKSRYNFGLGLGYKFKNKYSLEMRYHPTRSLVAEYLNWKSNYNALAIMFGYSIF